MRADVGLLSEVLTEERLQLADCQQCTSAKKIHAVRLSLWRCHSTGGLH